MNVFELFKESFGVGVVASKKQAKDPRYSHSLTVDVKPDTPKKNRKALGLTEATAKEKAAWLAIVQPYAEHAAKMLGINPRFILDHWALESGYKIPKNNNLGGLTKRGEGSGFREYDSLEEYTQDWLVQINKNWPDLEGVETMDDYVDVLQTKGKNGVYAKEEPGEPTYRERLAGMDTGYVPDEEPTMVTSPEAEDSGNAEEEDRQSLIKRIADQKNKITGVDTDPNARDWMDLLYTLYPDTPQGRNQARKDIATYLSNAKKNAEAERKSASNADDWEPVSVTKVKGVKERQTDLISSHRSAKDDAARKKLLDDELSWVNEQLKMKNLSKERVNQLRSYRTKIQQVRSAGIPMDKVFTDVSKKQKEIEIEPITITVNAADTKATIDDLRRDSEDYSLTDEERAEASAELRRRREELKKQIEELRKDPVKNQMELNRLTRIYNANFGSTEEGAGTIKDKGEEGYRKRKEVARDEIKSPADLDLLAADIEQQAKDAEKRGDAVRAAEIRAKAEKVKDQAEAARREGIQYVDLGQEEDAPVEKQVDSALDKMREAEPEKVTDSGFKVSPESDRAKLDRETAEADRKKREADRKKREAERAEKEKADMSKVGTADPDDPFFNYGDAETPPKASLKPEPEKVEPDDISGDFNTTKQRQHYKDKYHPLTPAFMMDEPDREAVYARERVKKHAAELLKNKDMVTYNKLYGGNKLGAAIKAAEDEAYAKFDEPQKKAPIVDKSINKDKEQPKAQTKPEEKTNAKVPAADQSDSQSAIGKSVSGMQVAKAEDDRKEAERKAKEAEETARKESERSKARGQTDASLAGEKAKREQEQRQKEQEERRQEEKAKRDAEEKARELEKELEKAKKEAEEKAREAEKELEKEKREAERKRQQRNNRRTGADTWNDRIYGTRKESVGESAIFRAIMRK